MDTLKVKLALLIFILLASPAVFSGELQRNISGRIHSSGDGVPFVAVYVKGTTQATTTDENGYFRLACSAGDKMTLTVKGMGYKTTDVEIDFQQIADPIVIEVDPEVRLLQQVTISGSRVGVLRYLPGSVGVVSPAELRRAQPVSGNEVLRSIAGVHVVEEEGAGLRANIGIRGLDPDKSRNVLILEDGIPVALAPYGEPEMYFTPNIERMNGIEILKGHGSILFGPQTIGGVINYITADPPSEAQGSVSFKGGDFGYYNTRITYGDTPEKTGYYFDYNRKQAENFGPTRFRLHDFNAKINSELSPDSRLGIKLSLYDESSNATYVGITQPMFEMGGMDDLRIAPDDYLEVRRYAASLTHRYNFNDALQLNTTAFAYTTTRNWNRQDFTYSAAASNLTGIFFGVEDQQDGAIYMRNSTGQRNRQFEVAGIEPRLNYKFKIGEMNSYMDAGARFLYEKAFEQRVNGASAGVLSGNLRDDEIRTGNTVSSYLQNKLILTDNLSFTIGLRSEALEYEREIRRTGNIDTLIIATTRVFEIIPGAGVNYNFNESVGVFAGTHRGFAPPRTKDAISNSGQDLQLDAEKSWNSELGIRASWDIVELEITAFHMDFSNQVIPVSESSGGAGTGYINGGKTIHSGVEGSVFIPFDFIMPAEWSTGLMANATYVKAEFSGDRYVLQRTAVNADLDNIYLNVRGNRTPYSPELTLSGAIHTESPWGLGLRASFNYAGSQYTDVLNTDNVYDWISIDQNDPDYRYVQATASGRIGKLDPYLIANLSAWYTHSSTGLGLNISVKNLFNERYISSRRPQGIRVGLPRFISAGISLNF